MLQQALSQIIKPTVVIRSETPAPIEDIVSSIASSSIDRRVKGIVSLFMCHVTPSCKVKELQKYKDETRIDIDLVSGELHLWHFAYDPNKPDVVIENGVCCSPAEI
jgi:hypothetical protein